MTIEELFIKYNGRITDTGCFIPVGYLPNHDGYLRINLNGKSYYFHRLALCIYLKLNYKDKSFQTNHKPECHNKICFNPEHLYKGSHQDNMIDRSRRITHCPRGHEFNISNPKHHKGCRICMKQYLKNYYQKNKKSGVKS